jgi:hypothetical protein
MVLYLCYLQQTLYVSIPFPTTNTLGSFPASLSRSIARSPTSATDVKASPAILNVASPSLVIIKLHSLTLWSLLELMTLNSSLPPSKTRLRGIKHSPVTAAACADLRMMVLGSTLRFSKSYIVTATALSSPPVATMHRFVALETATSRHLTEF